MEKTVYTVSELKALKEKFCSSDLSEDEKRINSTTFQALLATKLSIKIVSDQPSSSTFQNHSTYNKTETTTISRNNGSSHGNYQISQTSNKPSSNTNNTNLKSNVSSNNTPNNSGNSYNNSNSNNNSSSVGASGKKLTVAQQRLLFEKEREEILKSREKGIMLPEKEGEPVIRKYHDESDEIMMEFQKEARKADMLYEEKERTLTGTAASSSTSNIEAGANSSLSPNPSANTGIDSWLADIFKKPITGDGFSFDMANVNKETESSSLFQFGNDVGSSNILSFSGSHSKQSRLGSILGIDSITLSPDKPSSRSSRSFARDDDDDDNNTLEAMNSAFDSGLHLNGLIPDVSSMGGGNMMMPSAYVPPTRVDLNSVFLSVQNDSYIAQTIMPERIVKSADVLSKLGFNGPEQVDDINTQAGKSSFSFQDNSSSANKKKAKTPVMSAASRLQLNKMKSSSATKSISATNNLSTPQHEQASSSSEIKSGSNQSVQSVERNSPLPSQITSVVSSPIPPKPAEAISSKSPMQRLNINALFEAAAGTKFSNSLTHK